MKALTIAVLAGLAFALPVAANAQDNSATLASDARYCLALVQHYASVHQGGVMTNGVGDPAVYCEANPADAVAHITGQMRDENIPVPPRP
jgi:hypothetical protein